MRKYTDKKIIDEVVNICKDRSGYRPILEEAFDCDGYICASDSLILLHLKNTYDYKFKKVEGRVPDIRSLIYNEEYANDAVVMTDAFVAHKGGGKICGIYVKEESMERLKNVMQMLGVEGWHAKSKGYQLLLSSGNVDILAMGMADEKAYAPIATSDVTPVIGTNFELGEKYVERIIAKRKREEKKRAKAPKIWTFTIARYAAMYVEAATIDEAEKIAEKYMEDIDEDEFDGVEIDSHDIYPADEPEDWMNNIYDANGLKY